MLYNSNKRINNFFGGGDMPKKFGYKEAKEQTKYYTKLLANLNKNTLLYYNYENDLITQIKILHQYNFFSNIVEQGINGNDLDLTDKKLRSFISSIYYYKESSSYSNICKSLYDSNKVEIENHIAYLSSGLNYRDQTEGTY